MRPVEPTLTVRLDPTIGQSVGARIPTSETHCKVADTSVTPTMSVASPRNVTGSPTGVSQHVVKECVERMPTAKRSTIVLNVPAHLTSWEMLTPDVTLNAPDTLTVLPTRRASD